MWAGGYAALLLAIHVIATRGTGTLPTELQQHVGASAGTVVSRAWAQATALWFHNSWGHLAYNTAILLATLPFAIQSFGPRALLVALFISMLASFAVNLLLILPSAPLWSYAERALEPRLVGASIAIFAGAGMAWTAWDGGVSKTWVLVGFVGYEVALAVAGVTRPFVGAYHLMGAFMGIGAGLAMR